MKRIVSTLLVLALCRLFFGSDLCPQPATVNHGVSLRSNPSTKNPPIGYLNRNSTVTLLAAKPKTGFYPIETGDGTKGWVGIGYLDVESAGTQTTPTAPPYASTLTTSRAPTSDADLLNTLFAPRTKAAEQRLVENQLEVCGPEDHAVPQKTKALNDNRTDVPSRYVTLKWHQLKDLPSSRINDFQGATISVVLYVRTGFPITYKFQSKHQSASSQTGKHRHAQQGRV